MSQRRYYVLSSEGEIGPHNRLELRELLTAGRIFHEDELRSAAGAKSGTVGDLLNSSEESSSYRLVASQAPAKHSVVPRQRTVTSPQRSVTAVQRRASSAVPVAGKFRIEPRSFPTLTVILGTTLIILLIGWWWLSRGERVRRKEQYVAEASTPVLSLTSTDGSWVLGQAGTLTVHADRVLAKNLPVQLALTGSAVPTVDVASLPTQIEIPAGKDFVQLLCAPMAVTNVRRPAVIMAVAIQPSSAYQLGTTASTGITLNTEENFPSEAGGRPHVTWLSSMPFVDEWSFARPPNRNVSFDGNPLSINHILYPSGLSIHPGDPMRDPEAHATFALDGRMDEFIAEIGIDDEVSENHQASIIFQVWVDNTPQFDSGIIRGLTPPREVRINVAGAHRLRLVVRIGGQSPDFDHADWGGARLIRR